MFSTRFFFYNDGANEGAGADTLVADAPTEVVIPENIQKELADLRAFKESMAEKVQKSPEEIAKEQEIERADFLKYSAENDLLKIEDYNKYESLKSKADRDLVFESYLDEWRKDNPDVTDEDEIREKSKSDFEDEYKLNSENEKQVQRALARIQKEAKEIKSPLENTYNTAKTRYSEAKDIAAKIPEFNKAIDEIIKDSAPEKLVVKTRDGEEEIDVDVELTAEQRKEVEKIFKSEKVFADYYNADEKEKGNFKAKIQKKIEGFIKANSFDTAVARGFEAGKKVGVAKGSNVGANNPFPLSDKNKQQTKVVSIDESTAKVAAARANYGR